MNTISTQNNSAGAQAKLSGPFSFPGTSLTVQRMGYGAMQLAGPGVYGPPRDPEAALAVLRDALAAGVDHIDTGDFYGPHVTNQIIKQALHPYPENLVIVTRWAAAVGRTNRGFRTPHARLSSTPCMTIFATSGLNGLMS